MAQHTSVVPSQINVSSISRRAYNALTFGIVTLAFLITWGEYLFFQNGITQTGTIPLLGNSPIGLILTIVLTIVGLVAMSIGKGKQSVALSATGFGIFVLTFGATLAIALTRYSLPTIYYAFAITACISSIFLILGVMFPGFFSRIGGVLMVSLIALVVAELIATIFFHVDQTVFDYLVVIVFCFFLGYDSYRMTADSPTVPNAIFYAADIFLDIVNILIRILSIMDRD